MDPPNSPTHRRLLGKRPAAGNAMLWGKRPAAGNVMPQRPRWLSDASVTTQRNQSLASAAASSSRVKFAQAPMRCLLASKCRSGCVVEHLANEMVKEFKDDPRCQAAVSAQRTFRFGTMCSGSEITGVTLNILQSVCASNGIEWKLEQAYACELVSKKRDWILEVTETEYCCVYEDFYLSLSVSR